MLSNLSLYGSRKQIRTQTNASSSAPFSSLQREIEVRVQLAPLNCNINPSVRRNTLLGPQAWDKSGNADVRAFYFL